MYAAADKRRDVRALVTTIALIWVGCVVFVGFEQLAGRLTLRDFSVDAPQRILQLTLWYWLPWVAFAPFVAWLSRRLPVRPDYWIMPAVAHLLLLTALIGIHSLSFAYIYHYSSFVTPEMATYEPWQHSGHFLFGDDGLLFLVIFYCVIAGSLNIRGFLEIVRRQEQRAGELQRSIVESKLQALRMQINPHFLFNVLNSIGMLIRRKDSDRAVETVVALGSFFRRALDTSSKQWITLHSELEFVRQYVGIALMRFGERLDARIECDESLFALYVPSMILQPLVENSLTHGLDACGGQCRFSLTCSRPGSGVLQIRIRDNGPGGLFYADPQFAEGVGLRNVRERLEQTFGTDHKFMIDSEPGRGTLVTIEMPACREPSTVPAV